MSIVEGGRGLYLGAKQEYIGRTPLEVSVITFNAGNVKRGDKLFAEGVGEMVHVSAGSAGMVGFQELPTEFIPLLQANLTPRGWQVKSYPNDTDPDLSMAVAYDAKQLHLVQDTEVTLPPLPEIHARYDWPKREIPLKRKAQFLHFTSVADPDTHIVLANAHLSAKGFSGHREEQMAFARESLDAFVAAQGLTAESDPLVTFVIGDLNTAGQVGTKRSRRQIEGMRTALGEEFVKLNNALEPTSNAISSILHKAHDTFGNKAFDKSAAILTHPLRRNPRIYDVTERLIHTMGGQHRDHIFMRKGSFFEEGKQTQTHILRKPGAIRASDHDAVVAHVHLLRTR